MNRTPPLDPVSSESTSLTLLERVKIRDPQGWERFAKLYGPLVYHWARQAGLQPQDAEDIVQEVFRAVADHIAESFRRDRPGDSFRGWLSTITKNKIRDHYRAAAARPKAVGGSELRERLNELADQSLDDSVTGDLNDNRPLVRAAIELVRSEFEERTWQLFWKVVAEGRSAAEVAAEAGITDWAVYKAKSRVKKRLQEILADGDIAL